MEPLEFARIVSELETLRIDYHRLESSLVNMGFEYRLLAIETAIDEIAKVFNFKVVKGE